jgi:hypothetical protein
MKAESVELGKKRFYPCPKCHDQHPSMTTLLGVINSPALSGWLARQGVAKLKVFAEVAKEELSEPIFKAIAGNAEERWKLTDQTSFWKSGRETGQDAADFGQLAHSWIEAHLNGKEVTLDSLPTPSRNAVEAMLRWEKEHKVEMLKTEETFYSCRLNMAGTADCVAMVDGELTLIDWKTSISIYSSHPIQLWGYCICDEEQHGDRLYRQIAVGRFGKDGSSEVRLYKRNEFPGIDMARDVLIACNHIFGFLQEWDERHPYVKKEKQNGIHSAHKDRV